MIYFEIELDLTEKGALQTLNNYLFSGWYVHRTGAAFVTLRKWVNR